MKDKKKLKDPTIEVFLTSPGAEYSPAVEQGAYPRWPIEAWKRWYYVWRYQWAIQWQVQWLWDWRVPWNYPWSNVWKPDLPFEGEISPFQGGLRRNSDQFNPLDSLEIRTEDFGGLAYHAVSHRVFKLNQEGAEFLKNLKQGKEPVEVKKATGMKDAAYEKFMNTLKELGLWKG